MSKLSWDRPTEHRFEAGLDRGVLYPPDAPGVAWNGLTAVNESRTTADPIPYYFDGVKYLNRPGDTEFAATIEAFTYPDEFIEFEGYQAAASGLILDEQPRKEFGFSYRTGLGDDAFGLDYGYRIHLVYNALAMPTDKSNATTSADVDPTDLSWAITTRPVPIRNFRPAAHVIIDSTRTHPALLEAIEAQLYGTDVYLPRLLTPDELVLVYQNWDSILTIRPDYTSGLSDLVYLGHGDLVGSPKDGLYKATEDTRLRPYGLPGLFILEYR